MYALKFTCILIPSSKQSWVEGRLTSYLTDEVTGASEVMWFVKKITQKWWKWNLKLALLFQSPFSYLLFSLLLYSLYSFYNTYSYSCQKKNQKTKNAKKENGILRSRGTSQLVQVMLLIQGSDLKCGDRGRRELSPSDTCIFWFLGQHSRQHTGF